jgi:hypothetical protein
MAVAIDLPSVVEIEDHDYGDHQRCQMIISFTWHARRRERVWQKTWERTCRRKAKAVVEVSCISHGASRQGICRPHLALLRRSSPHLVCAICDLPAIWRPV